MGRRGPLPKPTAQKKLEGNPGHRPLPVDEPEPRLLDAIPRAPSWLPPRACDAWSLVTRELHAAKMLAALDLPVLEMFCLAYSHWRHMVDALDKEGFTYRAYNDNGDLKFAQQTPEATLVSKFAADCNRWAKVLGLGPAYRVGLHIGDNDGKSGQPIDPIAAALAGSNAVAPPPPKRSAKKIIEKPVSKPAKKRTSKT